VAFNTREGSRGRKGTHMNIDKDILFEFAFYSNSGVTIDGWRQVGYEYQNETRWGVIHQIILEHVDNPGVYWGFMMETSGGDGDWDSLQDERDVVELYEVFPHTKTIVEYKKTRPEDVTA
jgi:hypothetical protein